MDDWIAIQRNPKSGSGKQQRLIQQLVSALSERGIVPFVYEDRTELDAAVNDPSKRDNLVGIVAAGGDGTVLDVLNRHADVPICPFPLGTENLLAKYLGVPQNGTAAADLIALRQTRHFDVGLANSQRFMSMLSVGFDADIIRTVHQSRRGHITRLSYVPAIASCLWNYTHPPLRVYLDDDNEPLLGGLVIVANLPIYALNMRVADKAIGDDGILDVCVCSGRGAWQMWKYFLAGKMGRLHRYADVHQRTARTVRIESDSPAPMQMDGDAAGMTPVEVSVEAKSAEFFYRSTV